MKATYINLGKTATKALLITQDISSFIVSLLLDESELLRASISEGYIILVFFTLPSGV